MEVVSRFLDIGRVILEGSVSAEVIERKGYALGSNLPVADSGFLAWSALRSEGGAAVVERLMVSIPELHVQRTVIHPESAKAPL